MRHTSAPAIKPTPDIKGASKSAGGRSQSSLFITMALDMSWRLAVVILVPVIAGAELDKHFKTSPAWLIVGLVLAMIGMGLVFWQTMQAANRLPVPKLTAAQKRQIQKQYEEEDNE